MKIKQERSDFHKNIRYLKSVKLVDTLICMTYFATCTGIFLHSLLSGLGICNAETLLLFADGLIMKPVILFLGYKGAYRKNIIFAVAAPAVALVDMLVTGAAAEYIGQYYVLYFLRTTAGLNAMLFFASIIMLALTVLNIRRFEYIKEQPGYPYFSDLIEAQKADRRQLDIKSEFQQTYERYTKSSSEEMAELDGTRSTDTGRNDKPQSREMDDVGF